MTHAFITGRGSAGFATVAALTALVILAAVILSGVGAIRQYSGTVHHRTEAEGLTGAAESVTAVTMREVVAAYHQWLAANAQPDRLASADAYLDDAGFPAAGSGPGLDLVTELGLSFGGASGMELGAHQVLDVRGHRAGTPTAPQLVLTVTIGGLRSRLGGDAGGRWERVLETTYDLGVRRWAGLDYAMLANNINCMMCHAEIDSAQRRYDLASARGDYDRVKIGARDTVVLRSPSSSFFAGSMHVAGEVLDTSGYPVTSWSGFGLESAQLSASGKIVEDASGVMSRQSASYASAGSQNGSVYRRYGAPDPMDDGDLPSAFPPPFADDGGIDPATGLPDASGADNRVVDSFEFHATTSGFTGAVSGGVIHVIPPGGVVASAAELTAAVTTDTVAALGPQSTAEAVFLTGTLADPILLNGDVGIEGDVVIRGYVKGRGAIYATGTVYLPSDVQYLDDSRFGEASDGTENLLGLVAGRNVIFGRIFHPAYGSGDVYGVGSSMPSFAVCATGEFNRREWAKTQPMLPASGEDLAAPGTWTATNPLYDGAGYIPRYYRFTDSVPVGIFNKQSYFDPATETWIGPELAWDWDTSYLTFADPTDPSDPNLFDGSGHPTAVVESLTAGSWISDALLEQMIDDAMAARPNGELRIDAALYSSNAIIGMASNYDTSDGELRIRGAVIGADLGLLAPDGLTVLYDERVRDLLHIDGDTEVVLHESGRQILH